MQILTSFNSLENLSEGGSYEPDVSLWICRWSHGRFGNFNTNGYYETVAYRQIVVRHPIQSKAVRIDTERFDLVPPNFA